MRMIHDGKVECITVKYTTAILYSICNFLYFLWQCINRFRHILYVKAELHYNLIPISYPKQEWLLASPRAFEVHLTGFDRSPERLLLYKGNEKKYG